MSSAEHSGKMPFGHCIMCSDVLKLIVLSVAVLTIVVLSVMAAFSQQNGNLKH